jgi:ATP-dependent helicase/DNAse subunit B
VQAILKKRRQSGGFLSDEEREEIETRRNQIQKEQAMNVANKDFIDDKNQGSKV